MTEITLPESLRPADGRFGSGPSKVRPEAVAALAAAAPSYLGTSHRRDGVKSVVARLRAGLRDLFALPDGYEVVLGNGGAQSFWDAATCSLIESRSQHLAFGEFSSQFAGVVAAAPFLEDPEVIEAAPGTHPAPRPTPDVDAYALTHNETSTGVMMAVTRPPGAAGGSLVVVDATSAAGGLPVDPTQFDVYYFAPQKCFASDGGLWAACCSPAALDRIARIAASGRWIPRTLDLSVALANSRQDQTLNTPALATLFLFDQQLQWMLGQGGLDWAVARCRSSAASIYGWAERSPVAAPFVADPAQRSTVVATVDLDPAVSADTVCAVLRRHGIVDIEGYRKLGRNQLRVALFPAIDPADVECLTAAIDHVVARLG
jgi:phosphoserine aminotransferase